MRSRTQVIVDGLLTTNGATLCTGLGATLVIVSHPVPAAGLLDAALTAAIPFVLAIGMKLLGSWIEIRTHRAKLKLEAEMKQQSGAGTGG